MLYVIPFIILLVVAVILKKRENSQKQEATSPKTVNKKTNKKANSKSSKNSREKSKAHEVEETLLSIPQSSPVPEAVRQKIQQLIQEKQYSAAEAQVNQALKKDNTQHELYLLLLEVHIAQKDEFAITQLISHIRSLALNKILTQAETRQKEYESSRQPDAIDFPQAQTYEQPKNTPDTTAQFDQLTTSSSEASFDDLQKDYAPVKQEPAVEVEPLEFNFSFEQKTTEVDSAKPEDKISTQTNSETNDLNTLEFSFDLETIPNKAEKSFETTSELSVETIKIDTTTTPDIDLDFSDFSIDKDTASQSNISQETVLEENIQTQPLSIETLEFSLNPIESKDNQPNLNESELSLEDNDPLVQAFPELKQLDENELDLQLAEQYIKLGAYPAAHALLASNEQKFNTEQQQRAKNLLNRIAS
jgi:thioredoxin-like negative regulator of GroEL